MEMKTSFGTYKGVYLQIGRYQADGSVAIEAWNNQDGPIARLTVCLCDGSLAEDEAYVDTNNCPRAVEFIEKEGLGKRTGRTGRSGYCTYPVVKFDMEQLREHGTEVA